MAKTGFHLLEGSAVAADHQAEAHLKAPDPAGGARVEETDAVLAQHRTPADAVLVVAVAAIDQDVTGREERDQGVDRLVGRGARRHHHPDYAGLGEAGCKISQRGDFADIGVGVEAENCVAAAAQPFSEPRTHAPKAHHADRHRARAFHRDAPPAKVWRDAEQVVVS